MGCQVAEKPFSSFSNPPEAVSKACKVCKSTESILMCACKNIGYCSRGCQKDDWKNHKISCSRTKSHSKEKVATDYKSKINSGFQGTQTNGKVVMNSKKTLAHFLYEAPVMDEKKNVTFKNQKQDSSLARVEKEASLARAIVSANGDKELAVKYINKKVTLDEFKKGVEKNWDDNISKISSAIMAAEISSARSDLIKRDILIMNSITKFETALEAAKTYEKLAPKCGLRALKLCIFAKNNASRFIEFFRLEKFEYDGKVWLTSIFD